MKQERFLTSEDVLAELEFGHVYPNWFADLVTLIEAIETKNLKYYYSNPDKSNIIERIKALREFVEINCPPNKISLCDAKIMIENWKETKAYVKKHGGLPVNMCYPTLFNSLNIKTLHI